MSSTALNRLSARTAVDTHVFPCDKVAPMKARGMISRRTLRAAVIGRRRETGETGLALVLAPAKEFSFALIPPRKLTTNTGDQTHPSVIIRQRSF
jgi:hypothetical protein